MAGVFAGHMEKIKSKQMSLTDKQMDLTCRQMDLICGQVDFSGGIKNIIFDFGGVLVDLDKERCLQSFERLGVDARGFLGQYVQSGIFSRIETGKATEREFFDAVRDMSGRMSLSDGQISSAWNDFLVDVPRERLECLVRLKEKYRLLLLSNTNVIHWRFSEENFFSKDGHSASYYFEKLFLSFEMGLAKPDTEIFRRAVAESGVVPEETLFIDDSADNCSAARSAGVNTFHSVSGGDWMKLFP